MSRDSGRKNRSRARDRSPLSDFEIAQQKVRELEQQLLQKDIFIVNEAKRLQKSGVSVDTGLDQSFSISPRSEQYMSPIRIGVNHDRDVYETSSPIRIISPEPYRNASPPRFSYEPQPFLHEHSPLRIGDNLPLYDHPTDFHGFDQRPPQWYQDESDVRVDEMPKWPMHRTPSPEPQQILAPPSFSAVWQNQEDIHVDPMPVFPMSGRDDEEDQHHAPRQSQKRNEPRRESGSNREQKARLQMEMIALQAEKAANVANVMRTKKVVEKKHTETPEEEDPRKVREHVRQIKKQVLKDLEREKEEDFQRRKIEREKRHAQLKKAQEEEEKKRKALKRRSEDKQTTKSSTSSVADHSSSSKPNSRTDSDEKFLKFLHTVLGSIECEAHRIDSRNQTMYKGTCFVVNIPKELVYSSCERSNKGDAYKHAIAKYVLKLIDLGVINENMRLMMTRVDKGAEFMAELVESLCNDIAIYGTQISVTKTPDMKNKFVSFCKEKSEEFWKAPEVREKLNKFLTKHNQMDDVLRTLSNSIGESSRKQSGRNVSREKRRRTRSKSPSPSNKSSLERLFASHETGLFDAVGNHTIPAVPPLSQMNNFMVQGTSAPSYLSMPTYSQPHMMTNVYSPHQQYYHQNPAAFHPQMQMEPGVPMGMQPLIPPLMHQPMDVQHQLNLHQSGVHPGANHQARLHPRPQSKNRRRGQSKPAMRKEEDIDLMDEIFK